MFQKNNNTPVVAKPAANKKDAIPSVITKDMHILGNIVSEGNVDFNGALDGNIRCTTLTLRENGLIKGEIVAGTALIYGKVRGLIRAKSIQLFASCHVEGILMHESITIEDGAFVDGKFKRTDKVSSGDEDNADFAFDEKISGDPKVLENLRLIAG